MANDKSTDTAFDREDKQVSDGNSNCQRDSDVLIINHLREALAKENADAEKWSCECQRLERERNESRAACADWERFAHDVILSRKSDGLWVPTDDLLIAYEKRKTDAGKGWLSPEVKEKLRHAINAIGAENHNLECPNCPACRRVEEALKLLETE